MRTSRRSLRARPAHEKRRGALGARALKQKRPSGSGLDEHARTASLSCLPPGDHFDDEWRETLSESQRVGVEWHISKSHADKITQVREHYLTEISAVPSRHRRTRRAVHVVAVPIG